MIRKALLSSVNNINNNNHLQKELLLKSYLRKTSNQFICLNNAELAKKLCEKISNDIGADHNNKYIFEASPGPGILTEQLLKHTNAKIRVFEHIHKQRSHLEKLQKKFGNDRLEIVDQQILGNFFHFLSKNLN